MTCESVNSQRSLTSILKYFAIIKKFILWGKVLEWSGRWMGSITVRLDYSNSPSYPYCVLQPVYRNLAK